MTRDEVIIEIEELAAATSKKFPAVASILYGLAGALHMGSELEMAAHCRKFVLVMKRQAEKAQALEKARLN